MLQTLIAEASTGYMYGVDSFYDGPCASSYDPYAHAELLEAKLVSNMSLPPDKPAAYSHELNVIFFRADLLEDEERCAIAHEIVHFEHKDVGTTRFQEDRAERISTLRMIRPSKLSEALGFSDDYEEAARELQVTQKTMLTYLDLASKGLLPQ